MTSPEQATLRNLLAANRASHTQQVVAANRAALPQQATVLGYDATTGTVVARDSRGGVLHLPTTLTNGNLTPGQVVAVQLPGSLGGGVADAPPR